jgi:prolyl oligopeptidase
MTALMVRRRLVPLAAAGLIGCGSTAKMPEAPPAPTPAVTAPSAEAPPVATPAPTRDDPPTLRQDVVETLHGIEIHDPYRWLEDASRPEVQDWMKAQNAYARSHLAQLPGREALAKRFAEVFYFDSLGAPLHRGSRYFFTRKHKEQEKAVVYWKQGERGADKVLLDPNAWSTDGSAGLRGWWASDDGRHVAFNRNEHNADEATMSVIEVATGKLLADTIPGTRYSGASWTPDGRGFYYVRIPPPDPVAVADRPGLADVRYHALGSDPARDPVVHEATHDARTFQNPTLSHDGHWLFVEVHHGWNATDVYVKDLRRKQKDWTPLVVGVNATFRVEAHRDVFYVSTDDGAPRYRLFAVDPARMGRDQWREIVPEDAGTLESFTIAGNHLVLRYLRGAANEVEVHDLHGKRLRALELPPLGAVGQVVGLPTDDTAYLSYTSFTEPQVIYKVSIASGAVAPWARIQLPVDTSQFTTEQVRYPSTDGTEITMFLLHRKDAVKNGQNPTYLTGYGGFGLSALPGFVSSRSSWAVHAVWLEHGGIVAVPNLRGGGEYGEDWHKAGMLLEKQHVFDDFLAAARWLSASGWTSPQHLAISGGSNGGLLMGAAITQGPELFKAVVCEVPLLDMVRYHQFGSGKTWVSEYGSAEDAAQLKALHGYSPYHRVKKDVAYPAILLSSSDHDDRVDPMHARKFAAMLQWANGGDAPVWLRIQANAGHGGSDQVKEKIDQAVETYAFLMWQLGMK